MKGELTLKVLEALEKGITTTTDLVAAFLASGYGASKRKLDYEFEKRQKGRQFLVSKIKTALDDYDRFHKFISQLRAYDLIEKINNKKNTKWKITRKGAETIKRLRKRSLKQLPYIRYRNAEKDENLKIIIFDVPEQERYKREWLRSALKLLGFRMLQKSVWAGKFKIPEGFLEDCYQIRLIPYIEIFAVSKTGSLKQII